VGDGMESRNKIQKNGTSVPVHTQSLKEFYN
jgi:hypothetical protein